MTALKIFCLFEPIPDSLVPIAYGPRREKTCLREPIPDSLVPIAYGPRREKTCLRGFANNKGADQPAHPRSLISAFVISF